MSEVFWIYVNNMRLVENGRTCSKFCSFSNRESVKKWITEKICLIYWVRERNILLYVRKNEKNK